MMELPCNDFSNEFSDNEQTFVIKTFLHRTTFFSLKEELEMPARQTERLTNQQPLPLALSHNQPPPAAAAVVTAS